MTAYQLDYYELVELAREKHRMRVSHIALPRIVGNINLYMLLYKLLLTLVEKVLLSQVERKR